MKRHIPIIFSAFIISLLTVGSACDSAPRYKNNSLPVEKRIEDLLERMTLEEKAAQLDMLAANDILKTSNTLSPEKVAHFIDSMNIGAIHDLYPKSAALSNELQKRAIENSRLGIPLLFIEEALHGYQGAGATCFPVPLGNASAWDTTLMHRIGRIIATETRAHGVHFVLGPNLDLAREIRWGRVEETFGEDVYLSSRLGVNLVKGLQGKSLADQDAVAAEPKHFAVHAIPESGSNEGPVMIGEREARNTSLYVFEKAITEGKAGGVMAAYHEIDGIPSVANKWLLTDVLRNEWGFDGMVVTDLGAIARQIRNHHTASTDKEAIVNSIRAGLDMQFYDFKYDVFQQAIVEAIEDGSLSLKELDRAVGDVLRIKFRLGLFENPYTDTTRVEKVFHSAEHQAVALQVARQSVVLLKNNQEILPFGADIKKITVAGNLANSTYVGGYSPAGAKAISVYEALKQQVGDQIEINYINNEVSDRYAYIPVTLMSSEGGLSDNRLKVEFFNNATLEGTPAYVDFDTNLTPYWHNLSPAPGINPDNFSVRWSGYLTVPVTGNYEFDFRADDYGRIFIDDQLFIDNWNDEMNNKGISKQIKLQAGRKIPFRVEYAELDGNAAMWLKWRLADMAASSVFADVTRAASSSDLTIVVMGETREEVGESRDRQNLYPHAMDMEILKAAAKSGKPVVTVMITGRPLILTDIDTYSTALLQTWFPGEATGTGIVDVLRGTYNPSGRLTISFPKTQGALPVYYSRKPSSHRRYVDGNGEPLFSFGYGMSYTSFDYGELSVEPADPTVRDQITVSLDITNTGKREGTEIVQLYINDVFSSVATPVQELKGFSNVTLNAGETKRISMVLTPEHLSLLNIDMKRVVEPGEFEIMVGSSSTNIRQRTTITVQ